MFHKGSRYEKVPTLWHEEPSGRRIAYVAARRLLPPPTAATPYAVQGGDRLDLLAFRHGRDPESFWRICDANLALWPDDTLRRPGSRILLPPPEG